MRENSTNIIMINIKLISWKNYWMRWNHCLTDYKESHRKYRTKNKWNHIGVDGRWILYEILGI